MTTRPSPSPAPTDGAWMAGDGEHLLKLFGRLTSAAMQLQAPGHALRLVLGMQALRPGQPEPLLLQASILLSSRQPHAAAELVCGLAHPQARAIQALCAVLLDDPSSVALAREAADSSDEQAIELANIVLAEHGEARPAPTGAMH